MTTIACKAGQMAADTQLTGDYILRAQKIYRLPSGAIVCGCGDWYLAYAAIDWLLNGQQGEQPKFKGACLLALHPDGTIHMAENQFPFFPLLDKIAAIGCGAQGAVLAMNAGASAGEAVKAVAKIDANTNDSVQMLELEKPKRRVR